MSDIRERLQCNIISLLKEKNISQKKFAELLGVSQAAVTNWVKGKNSPDIELVAKMCEIFDVNFSELVNFDDESNSHKEKLIANYEALNNLGKNKLLEYSEDLLGSGNYTNKVYQIKTAARDGSFKTTTVTDDDLKKLMDLPDVDDLK